MVKNSNRFNWTVSDTVRLEKASIKMRPKPKRIKPRMSFKGRFLPAAAGEAGLVFSGAPKNSSKEVWGMRKRPWCLVPRLALIRPSFKYL